MNWFIAHLVGDYLCQNDWMASGKKQKSWICLVHVVTYLLPFLFLVLISSLSIAWWQFLLIGAQHFAQDRAGFVVWSMKKIGKTNFAQPPMAPWSIVVIDNIYHLVWIAGVLACG